MSSSAGYCATLLGVDNTRAALTCSDSSLTVNGVSGSNGSQPFTRFGSVSCYPTIKQLAVDSATSGWVTQIKGAGSGILKGFWFALGSSDQVQESQAVLINITIDGVSTIGNTSNMGYYATGYGTDAQSIWNSQCGIDAVGLTDDMLFGTGCNTLDNNSNYPLNIIGPLFGSNSMETGQIGGYFMMDMPFSSSWAIQLNFAWSLQPNRTGGLPAGRPGGQIWMQPFVSTIPKQLNPYGPLRLFCNTFLYASTSNTNPIQLRQFVPVMSVAGRGHGVYLRGVRAAIVNNHSSASQGWIEGRWSVWAGGAPITAPVLWAPPTGDSASSGTTTTFAVSSSTSTATITFNNGPVSGSWASAVNVNLPVNVGTTPAGTYPITSAMSNGVISFRIPTPASTGTITGTTYTIAACGAINQYSSPNVYVPPISGATCILDSTGYEDFFGSSYGFQNAIPDSAQQLICGDEFGVLHNSSSGSLMNNVPDAVNGSFRMFGFRDGCCPYSPTSMTVGWNVGDQVVYNSVAADLPPRTFAGTVYYYA